MKEQNVTVSHAADHEFQLATLVVQTASSFQSRIQIRIGNKNVNAKSIMGMTYLALMDGDIVTISVNGPDEDAALDDLTNLLVG
ncbi:MAG: HPr family phosphocarrier protein [Firmicutes bacterium]|nr:HPr family phosphocarrier protein [Bacillota bacterium]